MLNERYQWFSTFDATPYPADVLRHHLVVFAGPSGAGKTAVASALVRQDFAFAIVQNNTTRSARPTDTAGHFAYLTEEEFAEVHAQRQFFLCRLAPPPRYGYKTATLVDIIGAGRRAVLMFRHSGARYVAEALGGVPTVFLEGDSAQIAAHSRNLERRPTEPEIVATLDANRQLHGRMRDDRTPTLQLMNRFSGRAELGELVSTILDFLNHAARP